MRSEKEMRPLVDLSRSIFQTWRPPPKWTGSQWADNRRRLSSEASAEKGRWKTNRAEYQRDILDAATDPTIEEVIAMLSAQLGKTEILLNGIGYYIDFDPSPIMLVQPTLELAEAFSKDRLAPMLRDTPCLRSKVSDGKSRDGGNTIYQKVFHGGHVTLSGGNSPTSLRSRPIRVLYIDEESALKVTSEGDPVKLAEKRTANFWNRRIVKVSTPTIKDFCRIEKDFKRGDQRYFHIPCPRCEMPHVLKWGNIVWPEDEPKKAKFKCPHCEGLFNNAEKNRAVAKCGPGPDGKKPIGIDGKHLGWRATQPFKGIASFHCWEAYSPWSSLYRIVKDFLESKDDPGLLQVWVNTCLGETWEGVGDAVNDEELMKRAEPWPKNAEVPERGLVLTCGVDVQQDRLELETVAWAGGEESWSVDYRVIHGDPDIPEGQPGSPWNDLTNHIRRPWKHESGGQCSIEATCIDSGGSNTQEVYKYVKRHKGERVFAIKGRGGTGIPIVGSPQRKRSGNKTKRPVDVYIVGVDQAKSIVYRRLKQTAPGEPGYCHFPAGRSVDYFKQLTAEKQITKFVKGFPVAEWHKKEGVRNEALDCRVYAFAALILRAPAFDRIAWKLKQIAKIHGKKKVTRAEDGADPEEPEETEESADNQPAEEPEEQKSEQPRAKRRTARRGRQRGSYVSSW